MATKVAAVCVAVAAVALPGTAAAQYKNSQFGLDAGYWLSTKPSVYDANGNILSGNKLPLRLPGALRIGGESDFKMDADHWWLVVRLNLGFFIRNTPNPNDPNNPSAACTDPTSAACKNARFDYASDQQIGDLLGVQGVLGVRYVIFTDRFRPYIQAGLSYMRLFSFASGTDAQCSSAVTDPVVCAAGVTVSNNFLPHPDVGAIHLQPGVNMVFTRDIAINVMVDMQRWLIFNAEGNWAFVFGLGVNFFS